MALTTVDTMPPAPNRATDDADTFAAKADAWVSALPIFASQMQAFGASVVAQAVATNYNATSASSITVGTGDKVFATAAGTLLQVGQSVRVARTSNPANWMDGQVKSFSGNASTPGNLTVTVATTGTAGGPFTDWTIALTPGTGAVMTTGDQTMAGALGIGTSSLTGWSLNVRKNPTGSTSTIGVNSSGTVQSDVTGTHNCFTTFQIGTAAAAFTLGSLYHYSADQGTFGAGSTVTTQIGFHAGPNMTGAVNNFGFYGNVPLGANRWNFYAAGTAWNFFNGTTLFGGQLLENGTNLDIGGYKGTPANAQNGNYTLALTDNGKLIYSKNAGAQTITVPTNATIAHLVDGKTVIAIFNNGTTAITISTTGTTVYWAGTANTGNRTLAVKGYCTLTKLETDTWLIAGTGLS